MFHRGVQQWRHPAATTGAPALHFQLLQHVDRWSVIVNKALHGLPYGTNWGIHQSRSTATSPIPMSKAEMPVLMSGLFYFAQLNHGTSSISCL